MVKKETEQIKKTKENILWFAFYSRCDIFRLLECSCFSFITANFSQVYEQKNFIDTNPKNVIDRLITQLYKFLIWKNT